MEILTALVLICAAVAVKKAWGIAWKYFKRDYDKQIAELKNRSNGKESKKGKG